LKVTFLIILLILFTNSDSHNINNKAGDMAFTGALLHGRIGLFGLKSASADGEVIIKNVSPKAASGKHKVIDEIFKDTASFKETDEGEFKE
jgi:hypothetical protein